MAPAKKISIALDVSPLNNGNSLRGVGYYTQHLSDSLQKEISSNPQYHHWHLDLIEKTTSKTTDYSLVHYPFFDPFFLTLPLKHQSPFIVTVHDLIPIQFRSHFPVGPRGEINWLIQRHRLKKADFLLTDSHYSKFSVHQFTTFPLDRIYVTPLAADPAFKLLSSSTTQKIKKKYHLPSKFVLYVGDVNWNKNLPGLVTACFSLNYPLVIVGAAATNPNPPNHPWTADLRWLQSQFSTPLGKKFLYPLGRLTTSDLAAVYNLATLYCQPSFAEGFGLPLVEALRSGCPIVYSSETCLNEIMDYNGEMFNPFQPETLSTALQRLWTSSSLRRHYRQAGLARAKIFDWRYTALQTLAVYQLAIDRVRH